MRILTAFLLLAVAASIVGVHFVGRRRADSAPKPQAVASKSNEASTEPKVTKADYYKPAKPVEAKPQVVEQPKPPPVVKPIEADHFLELIDGFAEEDAVRKSQLFFLPCKGGPSDGRYAVFPVNPNEALRVGSMAVIVTGCDSYRHSGIDNSLDAKPEPKKPETKKDATPKKGPASFAPQGETVFAIRYQDHKRMAVEQLAVYALENVGGKPRLTYDGTVDFLEYRRFLPVRTDSTDKPQPTDFINIETSSSGIRRTQVFPTKCVGGPADGQSYPLLVAPTALWEAGLTTVAITDVAFLPTEYALTLGEEKPHKTNLVGHVSLYALEEVRDRPGRFGRPTGFQLKFSVALDARTYLKLHNNVIER